MTTLAKGDRVLVSCITSCGRRRFCKEGHYGLCTGGGGSTGFATHRFPLDQTIEAYETFAAAAETHALKVMLAGEHARLAELKADLAAAPA